MRLPELRHTRRLVRTAPLLSAVTVLLLAGGITVTTAAFGVVNVVWLRPLRSYRHSNILIVYDRPHSHGQHGNPGREEMMRQRLLPLLLLGSVALAQKPQLLPPVAAAIPKTLTIHGDTRVDP